MMNREQLCGAYGMKGERHSLYLMMKTNYAVQKISNAAKAKSIIDDNEQFCSADQMSSLSLTMNNSSGEKAPSFFATKNNSVVLKISYVGKHSP